MPRQRESNAELLLKLPWWVSAALGIIAFAGLRWGLPIWAGQDNTRQLLAKGIIPLAPMALLLFGILAVGSFFFARNPAASLTSRPAWRSSGKRPGL